MISVDKLEYWEMVYLQEILIMIRVLFVCHGNICRSAMAKYMMRAFAADCGLEDKFYIDSAATSTEEIGEPVYPPARRKLSEHGISCSDHRARQITASDYDRFDMIILMDRNNMRNIKYIIHDDPDSKISMMMDYTDRPGEVADPWYTGNFDATWKDLEEGCRGLLKYICDNQEM